MSIVTINKPPPDTFAEVLERLGNVPPERILAKPAPGTATEEDLIALLEGPKKRLCELVDGVLVEKPVGIKESLLASRLGHFINNHLDEHDVGLVVGADAPFRLFAGRIRMPDVSFIAWVQLPDEDLPDEPIADLAPRLAVEVLSKSNTVAEMQRKLLEYFRAGVECVWIVNRFKQIVDVYTSPKKSKQLNLDDMLDGGRILPGFRLSIRKLFASRQKRKR